MKLTVKPVGERAIVYTRSFGARREVVWDCYTKPDLVRRWLLGPEGWTLPICEIDLRVGGRFRYVWRHADGRDMGMGGTYRELVPPHRIRSTELFDDDWTGGETLVTTVFEEVRGVTTVTMTVEYASEAVRNNVSKSGASAGMEASYARLETLAQSLKQAHA
jgi:uncharacterized protein YndB with AHSA1/START domain